MVSNGDSTTVKERREVSNYGVPFSSVQEMVRVNPCSVPEKFTRSEEDISKDVVLSPLSDEIPILDLFLLSIGHEEELKKLDRACKDWGFFQLINHGIAEVVLQNVKDGAAGFFDLPIEEKTKYPVDREMRQGYGLACPVEENQTLDWSDSILFRLYPIHLRKPELWPTTPPQFKEAVETYSAEVRRVAKELMRTLSVMMKMDKDALLGLHKELCQSMRVNYYPTCCHPDQVMALTSHSDPGTITILVQEDDVVGLQIRHNHGWVPVNPIPNTLVVNLADVFEVLSNGKYKSIEHRAVNSKTRTRISLATIFTPQPDVEIEPLESMLDIQQPNRIYKKFKFGDWVKNALKKKLEGKSHVESMKYNS